MDKEKMLESLLNSTVERFGRQAINYEAEIANLNAQILMLKEEGRLLQNDKNLQGLEEFYNVEEEESEYDAKEFDD
jgi:hypothetical protein